MNTNWQKILAVGLGLVVLVGISSLVLWLKNDAEPGGVELGIQNGTSTAAVSDISGWKTDRNEKYGFEIKYPSNFLIRSSSASSSSDVFFYENIDSKEVNEGALIGRSFSIDVKPTSFSDFESWFDNEQKGNPNASITFLDTVSRKTGPLRFNGYSMAILWSGAGMGGPCEGSLILLRNGYVYKLNDCLSGDSSYEILREIGKTFKFIEPATSMVDMSGWKVYKNNRLGFEVKLPPDWIQNIFDESFVSFTDSERVHGLGIPERGGMQFEVTGLPKSEGVECANDTNYFTTYDDSPGYYYVFKDWCIWSLKFVVGYTNSHTHPLTKEEVLNRENVVDAVFQSMRIQQ